MPIFSVKSDGHSHYVVARTSTNDVDAIGEGHESRKEAQKKADELNKILASENESDNDSPIKNPSENKQFWVSEMLGGKFAVVSKGGVKIGEYKTLEKAERVAARLNKAEEKLFEEIDRQEPDLMLESSDPRK